MSGDGSLIVYHGRDLVVHDRTRGLDRIVANSGFEPSISRDGRYVLYRIEDSGCENALLLLRRTSDRWASSTEPELVTYLRPDIDPNTCHDSYEPVVSAHGRWVAWSSGDAELYVDFPGLTANSPSQVLVRQRRPVVSAASIDFGAASSAVERQATVTNVGPSGWRVTSIAASGAAFSVIGESCPGVLDPGASCSVTVRYSPSGEGQQTGQLVVRDDSYPGIPLSASGRLVGISDPEQPPPDPDPDPDPVVSITITPNPVVFDEVVVGTQAPGRTAIVENVGEIAVPIDSSAISGSAAGDFAVVSDGCSGTMLQIGSTCDLELGFTASDAGARVASLSVSGSTGASASATLEGAGRFDVELSVLPEVTSGGQSVFVSGTGYPASTVVQVTVGGTTADATTDGAGNFTLGLFVLSGVPQGEMAIDDVADPGRYDAEPVELLVVGSPVRPQATSVFSRIGRRHVSR